MRRAGTGRRAAIALLALAALGADAPVGSEELLPLALPPRLLDLDFPVQSQYLRLKQNLERELAAESPNRRRLARAYGELGMWAHVYSYDRLAERAYRNARTLAPGVLRWPYYLGSIYANQGKTELAREAYTAALEINPRDVPSMLHLAEVEIDAVEFGRAKQVLERALEQEPQLGVALALLGSVYLNEGDSERAIEVLEQALAHDESAGAHWLLAMAYRNQGDLERANEHIEKGAREGYDRTQVSLRRDPLMRRLKRMQRGAKLHARRGRDALAQNRHDDAIEEFRKAVAAAPDKPTHRINVATALMAAGRNDEALEVLEAALARGWNEAEIHYRIGRAHDREGRREKAEDAYHAALALDPKHERANYWLARQLERTGRRKEAVEQLGHSIESDPRDEGYRVLRITWLLDDGRYEEAVQESERALVACRDSRRLRLIHARLLAAVPVAALRDGRRSVELALRVAEEKQSAAAAETLAMAHAELGDFERALAWQRAAAAAVDAAPERAHSGRTRERLEAYERGQPCRAPWHSGEWYNDEIDVEAPPG